MAAPEPTAVIPKELGAFSIQGVLGEGGSAVVYRALWDGQDVALKVPRERELTPKDQERFLEEAKMLERVRHRAVVEVLGSGRLPDGLPYLVMRRYEGQTLAEYLTAQGALSLAHALDLFEQLSSAVETLHDAGLLHRDLKPENLLMVDGGRAVKLLDFGIAKQIDAPASTTTQAGIARGTPATMAPERFFGAPASKSTDVYELAVVFYAMLVGRLPWNDVTNVQARLNPLSPSEAGAAVPETLSSTVMEALSTRPERRPSGVPELVQRVRASVRTGATTGRVTAATSISAPPPPLSPQLSEEAQVIESRRDGPASVGPSRGVMGVAAAVLVAVGAAAVFLLRVNAAPTPEPSASAAPPAEVPAASPVPSAELPRELPAVNPSAPAAAPVSAPSPRGKPTASAAPSAAPTGSAPAPAPRGKPKGAPCARSSECASMVCAAEVCQ
ncbi:MAG: serine/threonine protein kinase [Polyangiaceae bacterium]|nr:serine/threonine protein kinase [Polyangiaceae bacterium]MCK6535653.1 serine/threonine protein kinase [Polyangiaceae bacterium]